MKLTKMIMVFIAIAIVSGCTTTGYFKIPKGSDLYIYDRPAPVLVQPNGQVTTKPFFWTAAGIPPHGGIPYRLEKNGETIKKGKLRAKFRVVSIFWPPMAPIYWPMGMNPNLTYDLVNDTQQ